MPTYDVFFGSDAEWALLQIKAATPLKALAKARAVDPHTLDFEPYNGLPVNEISIRDADDNELASWQDDNLRLQLAARGMFEALELCEDVLSDLARLDDGTPSVSALNMARAALAKAKGGAL